MESIIPSETIREYMAENGYTFSDKEIASLIYAAKIPLFEKFARLRDLAKATTDDELSKEIISQIMSDEKALRKFEVSDKCFYAIQFDLEEEWVDMGYFSSFEAVLSHINDWCSFCRILKYKILDPAHEKISSYEEGYSNTCPVAISYYNEIGQLCEIESDEGDIYVENNYNSFKYTTAKIPVPFKPGDLVKVISDGRIMVIDKYVKESYFTIQEPYIDVLCVGENGDICGAYINIMDIEYANEIEKVDSSLLMASRLLKGEISLYEFITNYRKDSDK